MTANPGAHLTDEEIITEMTSRNLFRDDWYDVYYDTNNQLIQQRLQELQAIDAEVPGPSLSGTPLKQWKGDRASRIGSKFEELAQAILDNCKVISYDTNVLTTISEIDFLISKEPQANLFDFLKFSTGPILGEAKCYSGNQFQGDWVVKLIGRMGQQNVNLALLFVALRRDKLQGKVKSNLDIHAAQNKIIIPIGYNVIDKLVSGENFLRILDRHFNLVKTYSPVPV